MDISPILEGFFRNEAPLAADDRVVVAFSGGPDSTALLLGMSRLARRMSGQGVRLIAAHLDHGLDAGSAGRAGAAARLAARLEVPMVLERRPVLELRRPGESLEAAARRLRYGFLDEVRRRTGARYVATAHHRDDQAETVLLRLAFGSGVAGLAGIRRVHGAVVRPLLGVAQADLEAVVAAAGLVPVEDPTNRDLGAARNRVRHRLLPDLAAAVPDLAARLAGLAERARRAGGALERRLDQLLEIERISGGPGGVAVDRRALEALPSELLPFAFALLHRRAGAPYPAARTARTELLRQLGRPGRIACDCGDGWIWRGEDGRLTLRRREEEGSPSSFTYTLEIPGELEIPEVALRIRLTLQPVEPWMLAGSRLRAGLALPVAAGDRVTVRSRRPGDRVRPLGAGGSRKLKDVLIDRRVPRGERDRLPLLCVGGHIAWVPGVTIDQRFRLTGEPTAWVAEVTTR
jgi:tRNA(Ile)-lysidine synthetase-like protein